MNDISHCLKCKAELVHKPSVCPYCGAPVDDAPPPVMGKPDPMVDVGVFFAAPLATLAVTIWLPIDWYWPAMLFSAIAAVTIQLRWLNMTMSMTGKSPLAASLLGLLIAAFLFAGLTGVCIVGCQMLFGG